MLFELAANQRCFVTEIWMNGWVVQFKHRPQGIIRAQWYELVNKLNIFPLNEEQNLVFWKWSISKCFTVKSVYEHLSKDDSGYAYKRIWKAKIHEKIKIFMWLAEQKVVITKDNMLKRNWQGP
jgi:hypothetical protein